MGACSHSARGTSSLISDASAIRGTVTLSTRHVEFFQGIDFAALNAPITEIAFLRLRNDAPREQIEALEQALRTGVEEAEGSHPPSIQGRVKEFPNDLAVFVGWDSREAHAANAAKLTLEFLQLLGATVASHTLQFSELNRIM
ncbi:hypothetical protein FA15DRAFT_585200 [Coprinopsis marcescibilis]|uniref:ABM domain-containing protein n=1 Tax=Coprinopsis marcescibilis TaxID=230819 RepID=A0A5C3L4U6_COPMA|nr:hypothetical protein FA15DRAFT_585200 [Coprinopsis marcescibilis]